MYIKEFHSKKKKKKKACMLHCIYIIYITCTGSVSIGGRRVPH